MEQDQRPRQVPARLRHAAAGQRGPRPAGPGPPGPSGPRRAGRRVRRDGQPGGAALALRRQRRPGARLGGGGGAELDRPADAAARHLQRQGAAGPPRAGGARRRCSTRPGWPASPTHTITARKVLVRAARRSCSRRATRRRSRSTRTASTRWRRRCATTPARWWAALSVSGPGLPPGREPDAGPARAAQGRRGAARGPDGPPRLTGPTSPDSAATGQASRPTWACTQSWNSPMWCSLGTRTPPLRVDPRAHRRLAPLAGVEVLLVDPVEQLDRGG